MIIVLNVAPQLGANQGFKVRTRPQYGTTWADEGIFTTNAISLDLPAGCYEVEITFLRSLSPLIACDPYYDVICTQEEQPCGDIDTITVTRVLFTYTATVTFNQPSPASTPCGGWAVYRSTAGTTPVKTIYSTLPPSILFTSTSGTVTVQLYSIDCAGNETLCDSVQGSYSPEPCTPLSFISAVLDIPNQTLTLTFTPSNPNGTYYLTYNQCSYVREGTPDSGTLTLVNPSGTPIVWVVPINPNTYATEVFKYCGTITDNCNISTTFAVQVIV